MPRIAPDIPIDQDELEFRFVRSSGPGGQNVNKVSTAVELRFNLAACPGLDEPARERLARLAGSRLTAEGVLIIEARRFRTQLQNRRDAVQRLVELVRLARRPQRPRRKTVPTQASGRRRIEAKKRRGRIKRLRRGEAQ